MYIPSEHLTLIHRCGAAWWPLALLTAWNRTQDSYTRFPKRKVASV